MRMEEVEYRVGANQNLQVATGEKKDGLLGKLGVGYWTDLTVVMCPECGLVRKFADFED